jgi:lysophospholipase L1-like esterase
MKWSLPAIEAKSDWKISFGDLVLLIGSCFSQNIQSKASWEGHRFQNPDYGTIFHPSVIARILKEAIESQKIYRSFSRDEHWFTWDASSTMSAATEEMLHQKLLKEQELLFKHLSNAKVLVLTFGTSWAYRNTESNILVANCHKMDQFLFVKELTPLDQLVDEMEEVCKQLKKINPELKILLTVSPVRHIKDGLVENNRSKARLLLLCERLSLLPDLSYFPSYEIMIDELRDYRFYNEDMIHPNAQAIDEIWNRFSMTYMDDGSLKLSKKVLKLRNFFTHRGIVNNQKHREEQVQKEVELSEFLRLHPEVIW